MIDTVPLPERPQLMEFLAKATADKRFRERFLADPVGVGREFGISFPPEEVGKIKEAAGAIKSINVIVTPTETVQIWKNHVFYPVPPLRYRLEIR